MAFALNHDSIIKALRVLNGTTYPIGADVTLAKTVIGMSSVKNQDD